MYVWHLKKDHRAVLSVLFENNLLATDNHLQILATEKDTPRKICAATCVYRNKIEKTGCTKPLPQL